MCSPLHFVGTLDIDADGDTITILDRDKRQHKIFLNGVDAPEKSQAVGNTSKENLSRLVFGRIVVALCHKRDRYGREVCKVLDDAPHDIRLEKIRAGYACTEACKKRSSPPKTGNLTSARMGFPRFLDE
ncbi:MAG: thermonuclease family protein [Burkholderiales bacterium]